MKAAPRPLRQVDSQRLSQEVVMEGPAELGIEAARDIDSFSRQGRGEAQLGELRRSRTRR